jgi:hypothetical protein
VKLKSLVELAGDDSVLDKQLEGNDLEGVLVSGFEDDGACGASLLNLKPAGGADTPAISRLEASEAELRHGGAEVVAEGLRGFEEWLVYDAADGVNSVIIGAGLAATSAVEAGHGLTAADVEGLAKDVLAAIFDRFDGGHESSIPPFWR